MKLIVTVYDKELNIKGKFAECSELLRTYRYRNPGTFKMRVPADKKILNLLMNGFIVGFNDDIREAYLIETIEPSADIPNVMEISGRDLRALLSYRIIPRMEEYSGTLGERIYRIINRNAIEPSDSNRKIPYLQNIWTGLADDVLDATVQFTGDNLMDAIIDMLSVSDFGWRVNLFSETKEISPELYSGRDHTSTGGTYADVTIFDDALGSMDKIGYIRDTTNYKTVATIAGEGEGNDRVFTGIDITGKPLGTIGGFERKELFVDARDIRSKTQNDDGSEIEIPEGQYKLLLQQRGWEKLCENKIETKIEVDFNESHNQYGRDYSVGDIVEYRNHSPLNIRGTCRVIAAEIDGIESERTVSLTVEVLSMEVIE